MGGDGEQKREKGQFPAPWASWAPKERLRAKNAKVAKDAKRRQCSVQLLCISLGDVGALTFLARNEWQGLCDWQHGSEPVDHPWQDFERPVDLRVGGVAGEAEADGAVGVAVVDAHGAED